MKDSKHEEPHRGLCGPPFTLRRETDAHGTCGTREPDAEAVLIFPERGNGLASRRDAELAEDWDLWGRVSRKSGLHVDSQEIESPFWLCGLGGSARGFPSPDFGFTGVETEELRVCRFQLGG
jgi:hypothetical protein